MDMDVDSTENGEALVSVQLVECAQDESSNISNASGNLYDEIDVFLNCSRPISLPRNVARLVQIFNNDKYFVVFCYTVLLYVVYACMS